MTEKIIVGLTGIVICVFLVPAMIIVAFGKLAYALPELKTYFIILLSLGFIIGVICYFTLSFYF